MKMLYNTQVDIGRQLYILRRPVAGSSITSLLYHTIVLADDARGFPRVRDFNKVLQFK